MLKYSHERIRVDSSVSKEMYNYQKYEGQPQYEELNIISILQYFDQTFQDKAIILIFVYVWIE